MEDLTDQVEIIFHPPDSGIPERLTSSVIQLQPIDREQPSTSRAATRRHRHDDNVRFRIPRDPLSTNVIQDEPITIDVDAEQMEADEEHYPEGDDDDWEETLIYVDLDDIPNIQELFAKEPDDFLLSQAKRHREENPKVIKPTRPKISLVFYNLDDDHPILQIGERFYMGKYEEPMGTNLLFREKTDNSKADSQAESEPERDPLSTNQPPPKTVLTSLIPEPDPPLNPVFSNHKYCNTDYELVAKVHKVLKMTRRNITRRQPAEVSAEGNPTEVPATSTSDGIYMAPPVEVLDTDEPQITVLGDIGDFQPLIYVEPSALPRFTPLRTVDLTVKKPPRNRQTKAVVAGAEEMEEKDKP